MGEAGETLAVGTAANWGADAAKSEHTAEQKCLALFRRRKTYSEPIDEL